jgi:hypothetical protein
VVIIAVMEMFAKRHMDIYAEMQTTAPRDETRVGMGWQISGRAVAVIVVWLLLIHICMCVCMPARRRQYEARRQWVLYYAALSSASDGRHGMDARCFAIGMVNV